MKTAESKGENSEIKVSYSFKKDNYIKMNVVKSHIHFRGKITLRTTSNMILFDGWLTLIEDNIRDKECFWGAHQTYSTCSRNINLLHDHADRNFKPFRYKNKLVIYDTPKVTCYTFAVYSLDTFLRHFI